MSKSVKSVLSSAERDMFERMVNYYIESEKKEISQLSPDAPPQYMEDAKNNLIILRSIKDKIEKIMY